MRALLLLALIPLAACSAPPVNAPSLAPRAAEAIDPRVPIGEEAPSVGAPTQVLAGRLAALVSRAREGDPAFRAAAAEAERLAAGAGDPQSESWVVAQQSLSAAVAAREPVTQALGDIDALGSAELQARGAVSPADQAAIAAAAATVGEIDREQAAIVDRIQRRLGG